MYEMLVSSQLWTLEVIPLKGDFADVEKVIEFSKQEIWKKTRKSHFWFLIFNFQLLFFSSFLDTCFPSCSPFFTVLTIKFIHVYSLSLRHNACFLLLLFFFHLFKKRKTKKKPFLFLGPLRDAVIKNYTSNYYILPKSFPSYRYSYQVWSPKKISVTNIKACGAA